MNRNKLNYFRERGTNIISDPVHKYIEFTVPRDSLERTEKDLIDNEWLQRLRWIHQLQCAIWVFPGAEHSRFIHSLGSMHIASMFAKALYPSLRKVVKNTPSLHHIEETLRLAALLHDVGHGPFGHFFDHKYLKKYKITHEDIGQKIITTRLDKIISKIHRSPSGEFKEELSPEHLAFLIKKPSEKDERKSYPTWIRLLRSLFCGVYTVDNLDYVIRDSLMCGISIEPIDLDRILYYSSVCKNGLVIHKSGVSALIRFKDTKDFLYTQIYFHRTIRSFDLHLSEIFGQTLDEIFNANPLHDLDKYLHLTDLSLLGKVAEWMKETRARKKTKDSGKRRFILEWEWEQLLRRRKKWRFICGTTEEQFKIPHLQRPYRPLELENEIRQTSKLPSDIKIKIDMAKYDNRPINPFTERKSRILIYDPSKERISPRPLEAYLDRFPLKTTMCFLFADKKTKKYDNKLIQAFEKNIGHVEEEEPTNI